jgi:branched-chain amino acid aminotransferase
MELSIRPIIPPPEPHFADPGEIGFGKTFAPHMFQMRHERGIGWHDAEILPVHLLELHPATTCLHYGASIFESLKAYRRDDGAIFLFRPDMNFRRMNATCRRMCMPEVDVEFCVDALKELVHIDCDWVPPWPGTSLYLRPVMFADDPTLGIHVSPTHTLFILMSPCGPYFNQPIRLWVEREFIRAAPGGTGAAKFAGNYAGTLMVAERAMEQGYSQVLWLDGLKHQYVEEAGTMNIFFVIDGELVTPALTDTILNGVTRDSILRLCESHGIPSAERKVPIDEVLATIEDGRCMEVFGAGTAAIIAPVAQLGYGGMDYTVGDGTTGPITQELLDLLQSIQYGYTPGPDDWSIPVD